MEHCKSETEVKAWAKANGYAPDTYEAWITKWVDNQKAITPPKAVEKAVTKDEEA